LFVIYLLAVSVGSNGLGGTFGRLFLSNLVAEGLGRETGSPFQLEMGFASLLVAARLMTRMRAPAEENLSAREIEVLELVAKGHSNKEVGKALHISTATVKTHLIHIYNKLGVDDRTAAVTTAIEKGMITL